MVDVEEEVECDVLLDALSPAVAQVQDGVDGGVEVVPWGIHGHADGTLRGDRSKDSVSFVRNGQFSDLLP